MFRVSHFNVTFGIVHVQYHVTSSYGQIRLHIWNPRPLFAYNYKHTTSIGR